ncbi:MAG: DUF177 domain-containing protein [Thermomicrobiales bacterium]
MAHDDGRIVDLQDDTRLNVASLLMEPVGSTRDVELSLPEFSLDDELVARNVEMQAHLTRLQDQILVSAHATGHVQLECVRCLEPYDQPFDETFTEQFFQTVDVRSGAELTPKASTGVEDDDDEDLRFSIDESHQLDFGESLRQWILLAMPMRPTCGDACPGPAMTSTDENASGDGRFADLARLLEDMESDASA